MRQLYVGTSGWSYKDWVGNFYPHSQSKTFDFLEFYAQFFNSVEVNSTYYTYINPKVIDSWINKVETKEDFLFTIKLHQDFTHKKKFTADQVRAVKYCLDRLGNTGRLGGLLIQFPYSFQLNKENAFHVKKIVDEFSDYEKFIEVRHKSWFIERFHNFVAGNNSSLCTIDQPEIGQTIEFNPICVGNNLYVRLHGRNEEAWAQSIGNFGKKQTYQEQSTRYDYLYSPAEINEIGQRIKEVFNAVKKIYIMLNNHPNANAVANALELLYFLTNSEKVTVPDATLKAFPRLAKICNK